MFVCCAFTSALMLMLTATSTSVELTPSANATTRNAVRFRTPATLTSPQMVSLVTEALSIFFYLCTNSTSTNHILHSVNFRHRVVVVLLFKITCIIWVKKKCISWFGYVCRHDTLTNYIVPEPVNDGRCRGKQRNSMGDNIKALTGQPLSTLLCIVGDRSRWVATTMKTSVGVSPRRSDVAGY